MARPPRYCAIFGNSPRGKSQPTGRAREAPATSGDIVSRCSNRFSQFYVEIESYRVTDHLPSIHRLRWTAAFSINSFAAVSGHGHRGGWREALGAAEKFTKAHGSESSRGAPAAADLPEAQNRGGEERTSSWTTQH